MFSRIRESCVCCLALAGILGFSSQQLEAVAVEAWEGAEAACPHSRSAAPGQREELNAATPLW